LATHPIHSPFLVQALQLPAVVRVASNGTLASGPEALLITLHRLSSPTARTHLAAFFQRDEREISAIFRQTLQLIADRWEHLLENYISRLTPADLVRFGDATFLLTGLAALQRIKICMFVDGVVFRIARPATDHAGQRLVYRGDKHCHAVVFQGIVAPNGLLVQAWGPAMGPTSDPTLLEKSGFMDKFERLCAPFGTLDDALTAPVWPMLYGDSIYARTHRFFRPFKDTVDPHELECNRRMATARVAIEHAFGLLKSHWKFLEFKEGMKMLQAPLSPLLRTAFLLTNAHSCLYRNQVSLSFGLPTPSLEEYFQ
jgi:hypothetical protein